MGAGRLAQQSDTRGAEISAETYSSPSEARAKRRRGGRDFYRRKGLPIPGREKSGNQKRDRRRSPDDQSSASLARDLAALAEQSPRFRDAINRLRHHVLVQARSSEWKRSAVLRCLGVEPSSVEEVMEETSLDRQSVNEVLQVVESEGEAAKCNRNGAAVLIRRDGKPAEKVYWRKASRQAAGAGGRS